MNATSVNGEQSEKGPNPPDGKKLSEIDKTKNDATGKASDVGRQLAFAGIATVWLLRDESARPIGSVLLIALMLLASALLVDFLQYVYCSRVWKRFYNEQFDKLKSDDAYVDIPGSLTEPIYRFFWTKFTFLCIGYVFLLVGAIIKLNVISISLNSNSQVALSSISPQQVSSDGLTEWIMIAVTFLTGAAVAILAFQANKTTNITRREFKADQLRRARTFGYMISVEVGCAQSAFYNLRKGLEREIDGTRIPDLEQVRRIDKHLNLAFLPHVAQNMGNVDLLPETCAVPLLSGMAGIENAKRSLTITLDSPVNMAANTLSPVGIENIERVCDLLKSVETRFRDAHRALSAFNFPGQSVFEWHYPADANLPEG